MTFQNSILAGSTLVRPAIQSPNYIAGVSGWAIKANGTAEFSQVSARGVLATGLPTDPRVELNTYAGTSSVIFFYDATHVSLTDNVPYITSVGPALTLNSPTWNSINGGNGVGTFLVQSRSYLAPNLSGFQVVNVLSNNNFGGAINVTDNFISGSATDWQGVNVAQFAADVQSEARLDTYASPSGNLYGNVGANSTSTFMHWENATGTGQAVTQVTADNSSARLEGWNGAQLRSQIYANGSDARMNTFDGTGNNNGRITTGTAETSIEWWGGQNTAVKTRFHCNNTDAEMLSYNGSLNLNGHVNTGGSEVYMEWLGGTGNKTSRCTADSGGAWLGGWSGVTQNTRVLAGNTFARMDYLPGSAAFQVDSSAPKIFGVLAPGGTPTAIGVDAGTVRFMSSSARYKDLIETVRINVDDFLKLRATWFIYKADLEEQEQAPHEALRHIGFIAEEVNDTELGSHMVSYTDGLVEGVDALAICAAQQVVLQSFDKTIKAQKSMIEWMNKRISDLETRGR